MPDELLTTKEAAALISYNVEYVRYLIRNGLLPSRKIGRDWLDKRTDALAYQRKMRKLGGKRGPASGH